MRSKYARPLAPLAVRTAAMAEARIYVMSIYSRHSAGCCWHCVLDDGNTFGDMSYEIKNHNPEHYDCAGLARLAPLLSKTQWGKLAASKVRT